MTGRATTARDDRSLTATFTRLIAATGPLSIAHFMAESNARYYDSRDPLGLTGDFITAPEVSQMFGELIGLWLADIWSRAGAPDPVHYVELGPGRGTLARDALRVMRRQGMAPSVHFVEGSTALRAIQRDHHPDARWHDDLSTLPADAPLLLVANEFLDALPVHQLVKTASGWRERLVGIHDGQLAPVVGTRPMDAAVAMGGNVSAALATLITDAPDGAILESSPASAAAVRAVAERLTAQGGAALFIDYGHATPRLGSTLQAVRAHRKVDAFAMPGEADLTAHVDFAAMAQTAEAGGARWMGTAEQGAWLRALGIGARAQALARAAPAHAPALHAALDRLVGESQMGTLFKVMGLANRGWPEGAGFAP